MKFTFTAFAACSILIVHTCAASLTSAMGPPSDSEVKASLAAITQAITDHDRESIARQIPTITRAKGSTLYKAAIDELSAGRQASAEALLELCVAIHTNEQRLLFVQAVCMRSRFSVKGAAVKFQRVLEMSPATIEGNASRVMLALDVGQCRGQDFKDLQLLAEQNPQDPLIQWLLGIQCRDHFKNTGQPDRAAIGARAYERVLELFNVAPVLVHHSYANILTEELDRGDDALKHRRIAISLEPAAWTYQGLANTYSTLKRFDEANATYADLTTLAPRNAQYWADWAHALFEQRKWEECIAKCKIALELDGSYNRARMRWGMALEEQGRLREALAKYEEAIKVYPANRVAHEAAARVLRRLGDEKGAEEYLRKLAHLPG